MKLASALAALLAFQHHGNSIWASAEDHGNERKLLLNQAEAAKRVDDVFKAARLRIRMQMADRGS